MVHAHNQSNNAPTLHRTLRGRSDANDQSSEHTCQNPMISQDTFFATQSFSVLPQPTDNLHGFASPSAYTVFADVSRKMPGRLPIDPQKMTPHEKLAVGLGVAAGILAFLGMVAAIIILRKRRRDHDEVRHLPADTRGNELTVSWLLSGDYPNLPKRNSWQRIPIHD